MVHSGDIGGAGFRESGEERVRCWKEDYEISPITLTSHDLLLGGWAPNTATMLEL
jgi:hypothetical protein